MKKIILATESKYKKSLFSRLNLTFESIAADIDESPQPGENAKELSARLAREKALAVSSSETRDCWIIGADQAAACGNKLVSKPNTHECAVADLKAYSGNRVAFYTSVCIASPDKVSPDKSHTEICDQTRVHFRELSDADIENYLLVEQPYDCAGAFKAEGLGISLFSSIESTDPTALIGLPLIQLANVLRQQGFDCYRTDSDK